MRSCFPGARGRPGCCIGRLGRRGEMAGVDDDFEAVERGGGRACGEEAGERGVGGERAVEDVFGEYGRVEGGAGGEVDEAGEQGGAERGVMRGGRGEAVEDDVQWLGGVPFGARAGFWGRDLGE